MDQQIEGLPEYIHINRNDFSYRKHIKQQEEDIAICECKYDANDPDSACGEACLNVLTSTECTPGYCRCGLFCKNQRFQKCEYAKTKLFRTEGRGWGLLADENIKAGRFVIEYCGEVISWKEARGRSQVYASLGLKDAFIISLNGSECIDATKKGSLGRFINHSCQPNCETRKWTVLGEIRVGIFAKQDISIGTELAYNYNFEWYGGAKVRCLCGAISCSGFLGAKSRGFQEDTYLWEDGDDRYSVEKIPLYDSAEDEPSSKLPRVMDYSKPEFISHGKVEYTTAVDASVEYDTSVRYEHQLESTELVVEAVDSVPVDLVINEIKTEVSEETKLFTDGTQQAFPQKNAMIPHIQSNSASQNNHIGPGHVAKKRSKHFPNGRSKPAAQKQVDAKFVAQFLGSEEAREEVFKYEEEKNQASSRLDSIYDEIRPAIEEHERDSQDSVPTEVARKWIGANCSKMKADFNLYSSIIRNIVCNPRKPQGEAKASEGGDNENETKDLIT